MVQSLLAQDDGPADVAAHDVSAACSGYLYALQGAHDMLQQRPDGAVLVITAEAMTRYVDPDDFDTVVVFGDAVTATVVFGPERAKGSPILLNRPVLSATGDDGTIIHHGPEYSDHLFMDGPRVYTRAVREMLRAKSGRIVNITSVSGQAGNAGQANYSSAKAGMIGLTKATAREVASRGITVNAVAPGFIVTELTADLPEAIKEGVKTATPLGRFGEPHEIAAAVIYLASREASYVTGQVLGVDGGLVMM